MNLELAIMESESKRELSPVAISPTYLEAFYEGREKGWKTAIARYRQWLVNMSRFFENLRLDAEKTEGSAGDYILYSNSFSAAEALSIANYMNLGDPFYYISMGGMKRHEIKDQHDNFCYLHEQRNRYRLELRHVKHQDAMDIWTDYQASSILSYLKNEFPILEISQPTPVKTKGIISTYIPIDKTMDLKKAANDAGYHMSLEEKKLPFTSISEALSKSSLFQ